MPIELNPQEREVLEQLVNQKMKPTKRQKAVALLSLDQGMALQGIAERSGITKDELGDLFNLFTERGLAGLGLDRRPGTAKEKGNQARYPTIEETPGVCGGSARISGTRIPVWALVEASNLGVSEAQILLDYPNLRAVNLVDAWSYASDHKNEIAAQIHRNAVA